MDSFSLIADRLTKLIPRLASDQDGEVVATARAIGRTLKGAGRDWHDLAAALSETGPRIRVVFRDAPAPAAPRAPTFASLSHFEGLAWLAALEASGTLTAWEATFVHELHQEVRCRPQRGLRPKQRRALDDILAAAWGKGVRP